MLLPYVFLLFFSEKPMQHRYGRHGPQGWLRRHRLMERGHTSISLAMAPSKVPRVIQIYVHVTTLERVFVVNVQLSDHENENGQTIIIDPQKIVNSNQEFTPPVPLLDDPLQDLKQEARYAGYKQGHADRIAPIEFPSEDSVREQGRGEGIQYVRDHASKNWAKGRSPGELAKEYAKAFLDGYNEYLKETDQGKHLKTKDIKRMEKQALQDKARDITRNTMLDPYPLAYQAAIRAQEILRSDTNNDPEYLLSITAAVNAYIEMYQGESKGGQRNGTLSSEQFSGNQA